MTCDSPDTRVRAFLDLLLGEFGPGSSGFRDVAGERRSSATGHEYDGATAPHWVRCTQTEVLVDGLAPERKLAPHPGDVCNIFEKAARACGITLSVIRIANERTGSIGFSIITDVEKTDEALAFVREHRIMIRREPVALRGEEAFSFARDHGILVRREPHGQFIGFSLHASEVTGRLSDMGPLYLTVQDVALARMP